MSQNKREDEIEIKDAENADQLIRAIGNDDRVELVDEDVDDRYKIVGEERALLECDNTPCDVRAYFDHNTRFLYDLTLPDEVVNEPCPECGGFPLEKDKYENESETRFVEDCPACNYSRVF